MVSIFGKRECLASCTYVRSADESAGVRWLLVLGIRYVLVVSYGSREAERERLAFEHLNSWFGWIYIYILTHH